MLTRGYDLASNMSLKEARKFLIAQHKEAEALYKTQFDVCAKTMGDKLRYMGTSTVVRDIDYITTQLEGPDALMSVQLFRLASLAILISSQQLLRILLWHDSRPIPGQHVSTSHFPCV